MSFCCCVVSQTVSPMNNKRGSLSLLATSPIDSQTAAAWIALYCRRTVFELHPKRKYKPWLVRGTCCLWLAAWHRSAEVEQRSPGITFLTAKDNTSSPSAGAMGTCSLTAISQ